MISSSTAAAVPLPRWGRLKTTPLTHRKIPIYKKADAFFFCFWHVLFRSERCACNARRFAYYAQSASSSLVSGKRKYLRNANILQYYDTLCGVFLFLHVLFGFEYCVHGKRMYRHPTAVSFFVFLSLGNGIVTAATVWVAAEYSPKC